MSEIGVFRDGYYNPVNILPRAQSTTISQASGVLAATAMVGGQDTFVTTSGATALTTDSAANILSTLYAALVNNSGSSPAPRKWSTMSWLLNIINTNASTLTLTGGAGVTISGTATIATNTSRNYLVTITNSAGSGAITLMNVGGGTN